MSHRDQIWKTTARPARSGILVRVGGALVMASIALLMASGARAAGRCSSPAGADGALRLAWIDEHLARTAHRAQFWTGAWGVGLGAATGANLVPLLFVAPHERVDWYTGAASTLIGIVPLVLVPPSVIGDARTLHAEIVALPGGADVCPVLLDAETRLVRAAEQQAIGQRWWVHASNVALNAGVGLFLGVGFRHWLAGAFNFASGTLIGELIIFTQPTDSIEDLRQYRAGALPALPGSRTALSVSGTF